MRLISLSANKQSFKPVIFKNKTGLNLIVARQTISKNEEKGKTFNGVGKSLLIAIVHFCLGASKKDTFKRYLPGWSFTLRFSINSTEYVATRETDDQRVITLNDSQLSVSDFNEKLEELIFDIPSNTQYLSFRGLLPFFVRPRRGSYISFNNPNTLKSEYQILMTNSYLLGLDVQLVAEKFHLRKEKERIKNLVSELNADHLLKDFFVGNRDVSLATQNLDEKIKSLQEDLPNFKVADDYYDIKKEADKLKKEIEQTGNQLVLLQNQIANIEESQKNLPDLKKESIEKIYKEAAVIFPEKVLKELNVLEDFYKHLTLNRTKRLLDQKNILLKDFDSLKKKNESLRQKFDDSLKYLNAHQALDVFVSVTNKLSDLKSERSNLLRYESLLSEYHKSKLGVERDFLDATTKTDRYLIEAKEIIKRTKDFFRELTKRFYPNSAAGITVYNNDGDNQVRFNIDAKIEADASDGINNVKIFCYDITLLINGYGHKVEFLFHDSRLLDGIDPRQVAELFKVVDFYMKKANKQYILTVNQNQLDEIIPHLNIDEANEILSKVCHELGDDSPSSKLLGIQIDMEYE